MLARLVREAEPEVEAAVGQRQRPHLEADAALAVPARPAEAAEVDGVSGDEQAGVVAELELQPRRRNAVAETSTRSSNGSPERNCSRSEPSPPTSPADAIVASPEPHSRRPTRRSAGIRVVGERPPVPRDRLARRPVERHVAALEEHGALAEPLDRHGVVRDEHDRAPRLLEGEDAAEALALERLVADGEDLVEEQDVGVEERGDREAEAHRHPRRVRPHGPVDRILELGEGDDLVEALADVGATEALDRAVQEHVLAAGEVRVEAGAELEERADPALRLDVRPRSAG